MLLGTTGCTKYTPLAQSAGFHAEEGRQADPVMQRVSLSHGINMGDWHSRCVNREMDRSGRILMMEHAHRARLLSTYPEAAEKTLLLGMLSDCRGSDEVTDPYGQPQPHYRARFDRIHRCVTQLATLIAKT